MIKCKLFFLLLGFLSAFSSYSADNDECEQKFLKAKHIKLMSPEQIRSLQEERTSVKLLSPEQIRSLQEERTSVKLMSPKQGEQIRLEFLGSGGREVLHSIRPKHLFLKQEDGKLGDLKLTIEQFQALDLNSLHPKTLEYILTRPDVLNLASEAQIQDIPKNTLRNVVFGDKASELSETTFHAALKAVLEVREDYYGSESKHSSLNSDQIESLVRNPYIINPEMFDRIKNTNSNSRDENAIYKGIAGKEFPEDLRVAHLKILVSRLHSILEVVGGEYKIRVIGVRSKSFLNRIRIANPEGFI